jgi:hypothetical protein
LPKTYSAQQLAELDRSNRTLRFTLDEIIIHPLYVSE